MIVLRLFNISPKNTVKLLSETIEDISRYSLRFYECFMETKIEIEDDDFTLQSGVVSDILLCLKDYIYASEDVSIYERASQYILQRKKIFTFVEQGSCGRVASTLLSFECMENYIRESFIVESGEVMMKHFELTAHDTRPTNIVSGNNAYEITSQVRSKTVTDFTITTLSVLNEQSEQTAKALQPMGLSYISVGDNDDIDIKKFCFEGKRSEIIEAISKMTCFLIINKLK